MRARRSLGTRAAVGPSFILFYAHDFKSFGSKVTAAEGLVVGLLKTPNSKVLGLRQCLQGSCGCPTRSRESAHRAHLRMFNNMD